MYGLTSSSDLFWCRSEANRSEFWISSWHSHQNSFGFYQQCAHKYHVNNLFSTTAERMNRIIESIIITAMLWWMIGPILWFVDGDLCISEMHESIWPRVFIIRAKYSCINGGHLVPVESNALVGGVRPLSFLMCNSVHHDDEPKATATGISLRKEAK